MNKLSGRRLCVMVFLLQATLAVLFLTLRRVFFEISVVPRFSNSFKLMYLCFVYVFYVSTKGQELRLDAYLRFLAESFNFVYRVIDGSKWSTCFEKVLHQSICVEIRTLLWLRTLKFLPKQHGVSSGVVNTMSWG